MPETVEAADTSTIVMAFMPGMLKSVDVEVGQEVSYWGWGGLDSSTISIHARDSGSWYLNNSNGSYARNVEIRRCGSWTGSKLLGVGERGQGLLDRSIISIHTRDSGSWYLNKSNGSYARNVEIRRCGSWTGSKLLGVGERGQGL